MLGAGLSYLLPAARPEEIYEGSRYVPLRRRAETAYSNRVALSDWLLAGAPNICERATEDNRTCNDTDLAFRTIGIHGSRRPACDWVADGHRCACTSGSSGHFCECKASRWLRPLPLDSGVLARRTLIPALTLMSCVTAIESWLIWVLGSLLTRCIAIGFLTLVASMIFAVAGTLFAIYANKRVVSDRL